MDSVRLRDQTRKRYYYRWNVQGGTYFVTSVTHGRRQMFGEPANVTLLLDVMRAARRAHPFSMLGYAIMPDHIHLLVRLGAETHIDQLMRAIKWRYTRDYKRAHTITGPVVLWQQGYWDHLMRNERDLETHLAYIHYNPAKHGYCEDALTYPYTSLGEYVRRGWYDIPERLQALASSLSASELGDE